MSASQQKLQRLRIKAAAYLTEPVIATRATKGMGMHNALIQFQHSRANCFHEDTVVGDQDEGDVAAG